MKKSTQVKNFLAILFLLMNFSSTYAEEDHDHHEGIYPLHEAMHQNRGYTQIVIGGLAYADCSHRIGVCELLYHEGHANQEAKRWGFFLPKLPVKLVEFKNEILIGINNKCYYIDSWKKDLWAKVVEKIKEADEIEVFGYKFRRMMEGHLNLDEKPLIEIMAEINSQEFGETC